MITLLIQRDVFLVYLPIEYNTNHQKSFKRQAIKYAPITQLLPGNYATNTHQGITKNIPGPYIGLFYYKLISVNQNRNNGVAYTKMAKWFNMVTDSGFKSFNTISATFYSHFPETLNHFNNHSTNASAESFNVKIKTFRATQRKVSDIPLLLFRFT